MLPYDQFKADFAVVTVSNASHHRLIIINFNVPVRQCQDLTVFEKILQQVENDLLGDSQRIVNSVYYQLSAVYTLVHSQTLEERVWLGSFAPKARNVSQITAFRPLDTATFVNHCFLNAEPNSVLNKTSYVVEGQESEWSVQEIKAVIVTIQTTVTTQHSFFNFYPQLRLQHGRSKYQTNFRLYLD